MKLSCTRNRPLINSEQTKQCSLSARHAATADIPPLNCRVLWWQHCFSPAAASALHIRPLPRECSAAPANKHTSIKADCVPPTPSKSAWLPISLYLHRLTSFSIVFLRPSISLEISSTWTISSSERWRLGRNWLYLLFIMSHNSSYVNQIENVKKDVTLFITPWTCVK